MILLILVSAVLIVKEIPEIKQKYENTNLYLDISKVTVRLADAGIAYMRAQLLIMVFVAVCCVTGLVLIGNEYALLIGILIAILDALPLIGSGMILIPWTIIMLINGNIFAAAVLITVYLLSQIIREVAEPKLIGNKIGIRPLYTLISMFIGLKLFGQPVILTDRINHNNCHIICKMMLSSKAKGYYNLTTALIWNKIRYIKRDDEE